jgi:DNA repair exonuclease SbcCD nuclease subunit
MIRTMRLLRKYCLGDTAVNIQVVRVRASRSRRIARRRAKATPALKHCVRAVRTLARIGSSACAQRSDAGTRSSCTCLRKHHSCYDEAVRLGDTTTTVNFDDPNLNVSLPVFIIHGNHDDPAGVRPAQPT